MQSSAHQKALIISITLAQRFYLTPAITRAILRLIFQPGTEKSHTAALCEHPVKMKYLQ
jgi:hypothetical protein